MSRVLGFVGLGHMGGPMSQRLLDAGHDLVVHDVSTAAMDAVAVLGAQVASTAAEVASRADVVFTSLPTPAIVEEVALGPQGIVNGERAEIYVDLSTTGTTTIATIAEALLGKGITTVDAPVSGGVPGATAGTLAIMVAAAPAAFDIVHPYLTTLGKVFHVGERPGLGQAMKLANNYLSATALAATSEAMVFGVKAGLDPRVMIDVLNAGSGRNSATLDKFPRSILNRKFDYGFATGLMYKDLRLFSDQAETMGLSMWVAESVRQLWLFVLTQGGPVADFTSLITHLEGWAEVTVGEPEPPSSDGQEG